MGYFEDCVSDLIVAVDFDLQFHDIAASGGAD